MDLQQLNRDVIRGRAGGKTIWQPRIGQLVVTTGYSVGRKTYFPGNIAAVI